MSGSDFRIEVLTSEHDVSAFHCDDGGPLDVFLKRHALQTAKAHAARIYVMVNAGSVIGYYTLCPGSVGYEAASARLKKGLARHPVPVLILARLAVDRDWQRGKGIGAALLKDAVLRCLSAIDAIGGRALLVHAKDDAARAFYEHFNFTRSESDPLHLFALVKDLKALIGE